MQACYALIKDKFDARMLREDLDASDLKAREILVEAEVSLLATAVELAIFSGRPPGLYQSGLFRGYPWRPGYAVVGRVRARGSDAATASPGERVLCLGRHASLQRYDASLQRPNAVALPLGDDLDPRLAVAARFLRVAIAALRAATVRSADVVAVCGLGLIGNLTAQILQLAGARVVGVSTSPLRVRLARAVGLQAVCAPRAQQAGALREIQGDGFTVAVDSAGAPETASTCASVCRPHARVVLLGTPRSPDTGDINEFLRSIHRQELNVIGVNEWGERLPLLPGHPHPSLWWDYQHALQLIRDDRVRVEPLLTHCIAPEELPATYQQLHDNRAEHLGVIIDWRRGGVLP